MSPEDIASLLYSGNYSDFTIECQGQSFKVHKAIVCSQSPVIDAALRGEFEEARKNTVTIDGFDAETVQRMLDFMYGVQDRPSKPEEASGGAAREPFHQPPGEPPQGPIGDTSYSGGHTKPTSKDLVLGSCEELKRELIAHVWTNAIADYYNVPKLCNLINKKIDFILQTKWSPLVFLEVANVVSSSTGNKYLHHLFAQIAGAHVEELVKYDTNLTGLIALDDFAVQFMKGSALRMVKLKNDLELETHSVGIYAERLTKANTANENMHKCMQLLCNTSHCRHCQADFLCYFETPDNETFTLRCSECRTRHKP